MPICFRITSGAGRVIVQDIGAAKLSENISRMRYASTQMTITNTLGQNFKTIRNYESRSGKGTFIKKEIRDMKDRQDWRWSVLHGALCYCYSGQCLLSSMIGGRSSSRGQCAQPCRLPYRGGWKRNKADLMSLKDLCTIDILQD